MAVGDAHEFPGFLTPVLIQLSFQSHQLLFLHASAEVRGENMPESMFIPTGYQNQTYKVMSLDTFTADPPWQSIKCYKSKWNRV